MWLSLKWHYYTEEGNQAVSSGMRGRGLGCNTWRASNPIFLRNRMRRSSKVISIFEIRKANRPEQNIFIFYLLFPVKLGCSYKHTWILDTQDLKILNLGNISHKNGGAMCLDIELLSTSDLPSHWLCTGGTDLSCTFLFYFLRPCLDDHFGFCSS